MALAENRALKGRATAAAGLGLGLCAAEPPEYSAVGVLTVRSRPRPAEAAATRRVKLRVRLTTGRLPVSGQAVSPRVFELQGRVLLTGPVRPCQCRAVSSDCRTNFKLIRPSELERTFRVIQFRRILERLM